MFTIDWLHKIANKLGLPDKQANILFLGLDNSRKTTLKHMLTKDMLQSNARKSSRIMRDYFAMASGVAFLVESQRYDRFLEAKYELDALLARKELNNVPVVVLGNKIDAPGAVSEEELRCHLGLVQTSGKGNMPRSATDMRSIEVFMCSVVMGQGYVDGLTWLLQYL
ncbi:COPII coat GTPase [Mortierella sp. GBA30]|nr:COPII coat GTPase [Mortierella sp. GBA30]